MAKPSVKIEITDPTQLDEAYNSMRNNKNNFYLCICSFALTVNQTEQLIEELKKHSFNSAYISLWGVGDTNKNNIDDLIIKITNNLKVIAFDVQTSEINPEALTALNNYTLNSNYLNYLCLNFVTSSNAEMPKIKKALKNNFSITNQQIIPRSSKTEIFEWYNQRNKKALIKVKDFIESLVKEYKPFSSDTKHEKIYELYQRVNQSELCKLLLKSEIFKFKDMNEVDQMLAKIDFHICTIFWELKGITASDDITPKCVLEEGQSFAGNIAFNIAKQLNIITNGMNLAAIKYDHVEHSENCSKLSGNHLEGQFDIV